MEFLSLLECLAVDVFGFVIFLVEKELIQINYGFEDVWNGNVFGIRIWNCLLG